MQSVTIAHREYGVFVLVNGKLVLDMPFEQAIEIAKGILQQALRAEEWYNAEKIAKDQAILFRAGVPFGLTDHPKIKKEAVKLALYDKGLKGGMGAIKSEECVGTPTLVQMPPGKGVKH